MVKEHVEELWKVIITQSRPKDGKISLSPFELLWQTKDKLDNIYGGNITKEFFMQDPLAELVKIDPKSIGVGQYQHDMNQKKLSEALGGVVEDCVNKVGVDLNTASASLLEYISGVSKTIAKNIVAYREEHGRFASRSELLKVAKLGPKAYEQCAGFMRITDGKNPLDATGVHPESYAATKELLAKLGYTMDDVRERSLAGISGKIKNSKTLAEELEIGELTLLDIVKELEKPALIYVKDWASEHDISVFATGSSDELQEIEASVGSHLIRQKFTRPLNVNSMVESIDHYVQKFGFQTKKKILVVDDSGALLAHLLENLI